MARFFLWLLLACIISAVFYWYYLRVIIVSSRGVEVVFLKIYVLSRVHERYPELTSEDVLTAFRSVMKDARRADGTWVAIGLDGHGRDVEMVYKQLNDSVLIYHAMTPPTKKTLKEINQLEGKRGER